MSTVSLLICTNRPKFIPWWTHQIKKQTREPDEVIVVANTGEKFPLGDCFGRSSHIDGRLIYLDSKTTLGELRQTALDAATGNIILWMDDDDWYHPRRIELSVAAIESGAYDAVCFPMTHIGFLDTMTYHDFPECSSYSLPSIAAKTDAARKAHFSLVQTAEERTWLHPLVYGEKGKAPIIPMDRILYVADYLDPAVGGIILSHGQNTWRYPKPGADGLGRGRKFADAPPKGVDEEEWSRTNALLGRLRCE